MSPWWWLGLLGLGAFHGLNPAMGWLFAVALGLHQRSRTVVLVSLLPIAVGHALAVAAVALAMMILGAVIDQRAIRVAGGIVLIAWALYHTFYGSRHRARFGMRVGMTGVIAVLVFDWVGVAFLRRGWINLDPLWTVALVAAGLLLLAGV
jgi:hypothetical protein